MSPLIHRMIKTDPDALLTFVRLVLACVIFGHGAQKLLGWWGGHGPLETVHMWAQWWGIPSILTWLVILAESVGAIALMLGFLTRFISGAYILIMLGAVYLAHWHWGFYMNWYSQTTRGEGFEYHILAVSLMVILTIKGGGAYSVDAWICKRFPMMN